MSNQIQFDPLLVRHLARELDGVLRDRPCASLPLFDPDGSATLPLDGGRAVRFDLHPSRGWVRLVPWGEETEGVESWCLGVEAAEDERRLALRIRAGDRFTAADRRLVVELHTNQWNAVVVAEEGERVLTALHARQAGDRAIRPGQPYRAPPPQPRFGAGRVAEAEAWERWRLALEGVPPDERAPAIRRAFAYTGTLSAAALASLPPREGFERWWEMLRAPARPVVLRAGRHAQPYPFPLPGLPAEPAASLLEGMARVAEAPALPATETLDRERRLAQLRQRRTAAERRVRRLYDELDKTGEADRLRGLGDLLLAKKRTVPRGASSVRLRGWTGRDVDIALDPTLTVAENAAAYYREARRRGRAEEQLPVLLEAAEAELRRWSAALAAAEQGEVPAWAEAELERAERSAGAAPRAGEQAVSLPFRAYRTSGGLEVRVGRSSKDNDRLTFHHSSPNDVWLHARSVPGSHVILRWPDTEASPPARDLAEAAGLAALFSKARSSALVPVDWTRRKHVRKPRGAPPGAVIPARVKTLFVEPDAELEERLRA